MRDLAHLFDCVLRSYRPAEVAAAAILASQPAEAAYPRLSSCACEASAPCTCPVTTAAAAGGNGGALGPLRLRLPHMHTDVQARPAPVFCLVQRPQARMRCLLQRVKGMPCAGAAGRKALCEGLPWREAGRIPGSCRCLHALPTPGSACSSSGVQCYLSMCDCNASLAQYGKR